jgi:hypothetical protein
VKMIERLRELIGNLTIIAGMTQRPCEPPECTTRIAAFAGQVRDALLVATGSQLDVIPLRTAADCEHAEKVVFKALTVVRAAARYYHQRDFVARIRCGDQTRHREQLRMQTAYARLLEHLDEFRRMKASAGT